MQIINKIVEYHSNARKNTQPTMPAYRHRPVLTAGAYAQSLREGAQAITPDLKAALASGPLAMAVLAAKSGHGLPVTASAVRSQPRLFAERDGLVHWQGPA